MFPVRGFAWGADGHRAVNRAAAKHLAAGMPEFLKDAAPRIEYLGPEPDRWREMSEAALKGAQEPDHYIDLEPLKGMDLPRNRYQFFRALEQRRAADPEHAEDLYPEKIGLQPYIVAEIYGRLVVAFREYRHARASREDTSPMEQNIVFYMGWLGHYVADAANPLHTTVNYDGWVETPNPEHLSSAKGIHSRMESDFVKANLDRLEFESLMTKPRVLAAPWRDYLKYLDHSHELVKRVYQLDAAKGFDGEGSADSRDFLRQRLAAGASMLRDLWYTAWVQSER